jgi:hypothetical protein
MVDMDTRDYTFYGNIFNVYLKSIKTSNRRFL